MTLTQKESLHIKDLMEQEKICIEKYNRWVGEARDSRLKTLFGQIAQVEQSHLKTLGEIASGSVPSLEEDDDDDVVKDVTEATYSAHDSGADKENDRFLCADTLAIERQVSGHYNDNIFDFKDEGIRKVLNHIQKEEQDHGKRLSDYMDINGMAD